MNWKRRSNALTGLTVHGSWVEDPEVVKCKVKEYFEGQLKNTPGSFLRLDGVPFSPISVTQSAALTCSFDMEEIRSVVWNCEGDKSPGTNGFNFRFIKRFWQELKEDIKRVVDDFHRHGVWPKGGNFSFIALIPKVETPLELNDFRPISLIGCMYKIVAKLLANRLRGVLDHVIDGNQTAFIRVGGCLTVF